MARDAIISTPIEAMIAGITASTSVLIPIDCGTVAPRFIRFQMIVITVPAKIDNTEPAAVARFQKNAASKDGVIEAP